MPRAHQAGLSRRSLAGVDYLKVYDVMDLVDLVANSSSSLPSYMSPTAPDNTLPLSKDPDGIFLSPCSSLKSPRFCGNRSRCECRKRIFMLMLHPSSFKFDNMNSTSSTWSSDLFCRGNYS
ncbi:hypothetical protein TNCV_2868201 [Trichonephila clavipes]|nr:hypothetical protein TNCV_2868201 [Trichonephila clavipes]